VKTTPPITFSVFSITSLSSSSSLPFAFNQPMSDSQGDFNRFVKNFSTRLIQTVVQSRLGRPNDTICSQPNDEKDWFSFKVDELGEVAAYIGQSLQRFPPSIECFTLEFILYTASGDYLPLEEWQVSVDRDDKDLTVTMSNLYHQFGILLRSCAIAARMTPLSRYYVKKQSSESFVVLYRIIDTFGSANQSSDEYIVRHLARLPSPFGTVNVHLFFKEKVETTPRKSALPTPSRQRQPSYSSAIPVEGSERVEASTPISDHLHIFRGSPATPTSPKAPSDFPDKKKGMDDSLCSSSDEEAGPFRGPCQCHYGSGVSLPNLVENLPSTVNRNSSSFPFAVLLSSSKCKCSLEKINSPPVEPVLVESMHEEEEKRQLTHSSESDSESEEEGEDSSVDPLASAKIFSISPSTSQVAPGSNLGEFLAQCRHAPVDIIHGLTETPNLLKHQIDQFASHINEFDHFVKEVEERVDHD
ncbi:hypothetical protein PENTCL1PPCAC_29579, partial [Pristionchus entomophagus]